MAQYEDIKQKIEQGLSDRQIAKAVGRRRQTIADIRSGTYSFETPTGLPDWMNLLNWENILKDIGLKHPLKFIWEESVQSVTSYSNFTKYLYKKYPYLKYDVYTHRQFNPGERVEVDWAGDIINWTDPRDGKINKCYIFVGCLGYSQLIFAKAYSSMKEIDFLSAHESMFSFYDGVSEVICPDNAKTAVIKANKYDPDLNPEYNRFTKHYGITVSPARVYSPKDKALVEGGVKIVQRLFKWRSRNLEFTSLKQINHELRNTVLQINEKEHSRFKISRQEMFNLEEKNKLKPLPVIKYELCESKYGKVHPDGTVCVNLRYYSVPYKLVGESVFIKIYSQTVEIYHKLEKVAVHPRLMKYKGEKSIQPEHTPESSQAYRSTNVQNLIQQSYFISGEFKIFIEELLLESPCGNLRRAQGYIREARLTRSKLPLDIFKKIIIKVLADLKRYNQLRVESFKNQLRAEYELYIANPVQDQIIRNRDNPMLRKNTSVH